MVGRSRILSAALAMTLSLVMILPAPAAFAWRNGGDAGNGYGTHDWVLDGAIRLAGPGGAWIDVRTALLATDDPDTEGTSKRLHVFYERGIFGGAPQMVTDLYYEAVVAYRAGDIEQASRAVGVLSHYYSDILNPFHSTAAASRSPLHNAYEYPVEDLTDSPEENRDWVTPRVLGPVTDIRAKAVAAASFSRARYPALRASFTPSGSVEVTAPIVRALTAQVLSRACNDLAEIILAIPTGAGISLPPKVVRADMSRHDPAQGSTPYAFAVCSDAKGRPVSGAAVSFTWDSSSGPVTDVRYTDPNGVARDWHGIGFDPVGVRRRVSVVASASGTSTVASTWYVPAVAIAPGTRGMATSVSNIRPKRHSTVAVSTVVHDTAGEPVPGLVVTFAWKYRTKTVKVSARTGADGVARVSRHIGAAKRGFRVSVVAAIDSGGVRSAAGYFIPR